MLLVFSCQSQAALGDRFATAYVLVKNYVEINSVLIRNGKSFDSWPVTVLSEERIGEYALLRISFQIIDHTLAANPRDMRFVGTIADESFTLRVDEHNLSPNTKVKLYKLEQVRFLGGSVIHKEDVRAEVLGQAWQIATDQTRLTNPGMLSVQNQLICPQLFNK